MAKNYYEMFGLLQNATLLEIKRAYRKLAMKYHPDKNFGDLKCELIFKEVNKIYQTLSNPVTRAAYDSLINRKQTYHEPEPEYRDHKPATFYEDDNGNLSKKKSNRWAAVVVFLLIKILFSQSGESYLTNSYDMGTAFSNHEYIGLTPYHDTTALLNFLKRNSISVSPPNQEKVNPLKQSHQ